MQNVAMTTAPNHNRPNPKENLMTSQLKQNLRFLTLAATLFLAFASLPTHAEFVLIDDFEAYADGDSISSKADWNNNGTVDTDPADGTNLVLSFSPSNGIGYYGGSDIKIADNTTGTLLYRARLTSGGQAFGMGMSDETAPNPWDSFEAQLTWDETGSPISVRDGSGPHPEATTTDDAWYNVWMVIDNTNDEYDVYLQSDDDANFSSQTQIADDAGFRNGSANNDLVSFFMRTNAGTGSVLYIDDIKLDNTGKNLAIPEPASLTLFILGGLALTRRRQRG